MLKNGGKLTFTEICDKSLKLKNIETRISELGFKEYEKKYSQLMHFYISKEKFTELLKQNFENIKITNSVKRGREKEFFRFNIYSTKK